MTDWGPRLTEILNHFWAKLPDLLLTFAVGYILLTIIKAIIGSLIRVSKAKAALKDILMSVINIGLWLFLLAALFQQIGLTQIAFALSGSVAIIALAISAGTTSLVQDLISGIFLAQDIDFNVGDTVRVGDLEGVVKKMDARKVRIITKDNKLHVYPNSLFDKGAWTVIKSKEEGL